MSRPLEVFVQLTLSSNQGIHGLECGFNLTGESVTMAGAQRTSWVAASIRPKQSSCAGAHVLKDKRFLAEDAPRLPIAGCPLGDACPCVYLKYDDRRAGPRRESEHTGMRRYIEPSRERRVGSGRRQSDKP